MTTCSLALVKHLGFGIIGIVLGIQILTLDWLTAEYSTL